jgi:hypothetical protein
VTINLSGRLDAGAGTLTVRTPDGRSIEILKVDGPADLHTKTRMSATPGTWTAVWTIENADGTYDLTWSSN